MNSSLESPSEQGSQSDLAALLDTGPVVDQLLDQFKYFVSLLNGDEPTPKPLSSATRDRLVIELCRLSRQIGVRFSKLAFVSDDDINDSIDAFKSVKEITIPDHASQEVGQAITNILGRAASIEKEFGEKVH